jgi:tetratricopeptide (TPR) repeat protein
VCAQTNDAIRIVALSPAVEILPRGAPSWTFAATNQPLYPLDRVRTPDHGFVVLLWSDQSVLRFGPSTELEIRPADTGGLHFLKGILSFFHRGKPGRINIITSGALAGIEGTEFVMEVGPSNGLEQTTLSVVDGTVRFSNEVAALVLTNGQQAVAEPGQAPFRTSGFIAKNLLQWCFYYPGVLDLNDLPLTSGEQTILGNSIAAYRNGDLLAALRNYPATRKPVSDGERIYHAALLLGAGQVAGAEEDLSAFAAGDVSGKSQRLAAALRTLIAAVKREPQPSTADMQMPTECLAASYFEQSRAIAGISLQAALNLAKRAVTLDTNFGFGWERVAELEFSFGRTERASEALRKAIDLSPRNAQALALDGFLLAARNKTHEAIESFDRALAVDSALGNAWLGRGLCRIRRGDLHGGREDLLIAAAMEPRRAALRSYLAKAWSETGDDRRALKELQLAKELDPNDPTAWLYSALLDEDEYRINNAISDLEKSQELNDNRGVYRSQMLLDQDRAARSANLARIYDEAGMSDVAVREASKAVEADYANYSAHMFLANSYDSIRDSSPVDLRYETPAYSEFLVASLLGPADGRTLAQPVSQGEYTSLFNRDGPGIFSSTAYLSRGAWDQYESQYGTFGSTSYAIEAEYASDPGQLPDQDSQQTTLSVKLKQALTPSDQVFAEVLEYHISGGDLSSVYAASNINTSFRYEEKQEPDVLLGYHHEWAPGQHTLLLFSRFNDTYDYSVAASPAVLVLQQQGQPPGFIPMYIDTAYQHRENIYSGDFQQIAQVANQSIVAGARVQWGEATVHNLEANPTGYVEPLFPNPPVPAANQGFNLNFSRFNVYAYDHWHIGDSFTLIGGLSFDQVTLPRNDSFAPLESNEETLRQLSPKAGFLWTPTDSATFRGAFTRSLGGFNLDQSLRLEPTEVAGFVQAYRSLIPESVAGAIGGATFETFDLSWEQKLTRHTYFSLAGEILYSSVDHDIGAFANSNFTAMASVPSSLREDLDFNEWSLETTLHQVIARDLTLGLDYRLSTARLRYDYPDVPAAAAASGFPQSYALAGLLHSLLLQATFNDPSGFFAQAQARWVAQNNFDADSDLAGDNFCQLNLLAGYRFPRRRAEISLGLLNLTDADYHLNPVNLYTQLPRKRTLAVTFQFNF